MLYWKLFSIFYLRSILEMPPLSWFEIWGFAQREESRVIIGLDWLDDKAEMGETVDLISWPLHWVQMCIQRVWPSKPGVESLLEVVSWLVFEILFFVSRLLTWMILVLGLHYYSEDLCSRILPQFHWPSITKMKAQVDTWNLATFVSFLALQWRNLLVLSYHCCLFFLVFLLILSSVLLVVWSYWCMPRVPHLRWWSSGVDGSSSDRYCIIVIDWSSLLISLKF